MTCAKYISCKLDFARHLNWGKPWEKLRTTWIMNTLGMLFSVTRYWFVYTMVLTFVMMKTSDKRRCTLCRWSRKFDLILLLDWFGQMTAITSTQFWNSDNEFHKVQIWDENGVESILNFMIYGKKNKIRFTKSTRDFNSSTGRPYQLLHRLSPTCCTLKYGVASRAPLYSCVTIFSTKCMNFTEFHSSLIRYK